ncbi:hypothetical protein M426DRAFT_16173 [Hypoxylon sp. CI-4A]|nr:hypothetical protein M426DRAFT_16173 [Hypoxylon sp. CI-4A]
MVKIALIGATGQLAREVIDKLIEAQKHEILGFSRQNPAQLPVLPRVKWVQTNYQDKEELVRLFKGVETVLCFFAVHLDPGSLIQKRLIDAAIEAGVKRFAPSEWAAGVKLEDTLDTIPWYGGKVKTAHYLEAVNKEKKVIQYTRFQPGVFMNYIAHPHKTSKYVVTMPFGFDLEKQHAAILEGSHDDVITWTTVEDIANVVARAVEYEGEWPAVGGIRGSRTTVGQVLQIAESIGRPLTVDYLKKEEIQGKTLDASLIEGVDLWTIPKEKFEEFKEIALRGILVGINRGAYDVSDEWNKILPDYKFTQLEDFVKKAWGAKQ